MSVNIELAIELAARLGLDVDGIQFEEFAAKHGFVVYLVTHDDYDDEEYYVQRAPSGAMLVVGHDEAIAFANWC